jgi:hypothetical protein
LKARQAFLVLFLLVIVLSGLQITASDYPFGVFKLFLSFFFWLLCCLTFKLRLLITPFGIFKLFLSFFFWLFCCQDAKGVIRSRNLKARQHNNQKKKDKKRLKMPKG